MPAENHKFWGLRLKILVSILAMRAEPKYLITKVIMLI